MVAISISTTSQKQNYLFFPYCNAATDKIPFLKPTSPAKPAEHPKLKRTSTYISQQKQLFLQQLMKPIFLIGYMGSGKTTLGKALAKEMNVQFIDLDHYIECRFHKQISKIFADSGEQTFRDIERRMLHEVACFDDVVVACGGGTPCQPGNMDEMNHYGTTIYLTVGIDRLVQRLSLPGAKAKRPLIAGKSDAELHDFICQALASRAQWYEKASIHFDSTDIETAHTTTLRAQELKQLLIERHLA